LSRGCAGLSPWWLGEFHLTRGPHLFVLSNVSQAALELVVAAATAVAVAVAASIFSYCNMLWGSFPWSRGSGVQGLIVVGALFLLDGG
jgi:apolipoprotein N-acyltransferase